MGPESSATTSSSSSPAANVKRGRDPEDDVYVDNLHSHKRYLSEIMASSLNGLTVGDTLSDNLMDSPVRSESTMPYLRRWWLQPFFRLCPCLQTECLQVREHQIISNLEEYFGKKTRDETSVQYSPMSEDSDDSRYYESSTNTCSSQPESAPTSPVSPYRGQKPLSMFISGPSATSYPSHGCIVSFAASPQPRQRSSDTEGRFPSSPSDICHSADLRRAALLRSVQMRAQPLGSSPFELQQESTNSVEVEERPCPYMKLDVDERGYQIDECAVLSMSDGEKREKACRTLSMNLEADESSSI